VCRSVIILYYGQVTILIENSSEITSTVPYRDETFSAIIRELTVAEHGPKHNISAIWRRHLTNATNVFLLATTTKKKKCAQIRWMAQYNI